MAAGPSRPLSGFTAHEQLSRALLGYFHADATPPILAAESPGAWRGEGSGQRGWEGSSLSPFLAQEGCGFFSVAEVLSFERLYFKSYQLF